MNWLKNAGSAIWFGLLAVLAAFAAMQATARKRQAEEWQKVAEDEKVRDTIDAVDNANAALGQAKLHNAEAERIAKKAEERINDLAKRDETIGDIINRWTADGMRQ